VCYRVSIIELYILGLVDIIGVYIGYMCNCCATDEQPSKRGRVAVAATFNK